MKIYFIPFNLYLFNISIYILKKLCLVCIVRSDQEMKVGNSVNIEWSYQFFFAQSITAQILSMHSL